MGRYKWLLVVLVLTAVGFIGVLVLKNRTAPPQDQPSEQQAEATEGPVEVRDYQTDSVESILQRNASWDLKYMELYTAALQKLSVERYDEAVLYFEGILTLDQIDQEGRDDTVYRLISLSRQAGDAEREQKYTEMLGQEKLNMFLDGSRYGDEPQ